MNKCLWCKKETVRPKYCSKLCWNRHYKVKASEIAIGSKETCQSQHRKTIFCTGEYMDVLL